MMHGREWDGRTDLTGWIITEKFDGCRLYWDGAKAWSRSGREIALPAHWRLPDIALDCELWAGRGGYQITRNAMNHGDWSDPRLQLVAFDVPGIEPGGDWFQRLQSVATLGLPYVTAARAWLADSTLQVEQERNRVQSLGGEGLMARHPVLTYRPGRTKLLLKVL